MAGTRGDVAFTTTCLSCGWKCFLVEELGAISLSSFVFPWRGHGARVPSPCPIGVFFRCWGRAGLQGAGGDGSVSRSPSPQALFLRLFGLDHSIWIRFFWFCLHCLWRCFPKQHRVGRLGPRKEKMAKKKTMSCGSAMEKQEERRAGRKGVVLGKGKPASTVHLVLRQLRSLPDTHVPMGWGSRCPFGWP